MRSSQLKIQFSIQPNSGKVCPEYVQVWWGIIERGSNLISRDPNDFVHTGTTSQLWPFWPKTTSMRATAPFSVTPSGLLLRDVGMGGSHQPVRNLPEM